MLRKMKRFSRDVGELMKDAHTFYNEANRNGSFDDDDVDDEDSLSLYHKNSSPCPWKQTQRSCRRRNETKNTRTDSVSVPSSSLEQVFIVLFYVVQHYYLFVPSGPTINQDIHAKEKIEE